MKKHIITALAVSALIAGAATTAQATSVRETQPCIPTGAHWENLVWHTWTGGPLPQGITPPYNDDNWNSTSGNPQSPNHRWQNHTVNLPYWVSHGSSGRADWFLWTGTWVPQTTCPDPSPSVSIDPQVTISPSPDPTPTTTVSPSPEPTVTITPQPCPEGQVAGAPDEQGNFVCQNDDPTPTDEPVVELHDELDAPAPVARAVPADAEFTG